MTHNTNQGGVPSPRRRRCTLRDAGHGTSGLVPEFIDRPAQWVHGSIEPLPMESLDDVPGAQPIRFLPDLSQPHTVDDPIGIPVTVFHHASVEIRRRVAQGLSPLWFPNACVLVVGHRRFDMSLVPVPECLQPTDHRASRDDMRDQNRALLAELRSELYREAFSEWMRTRDVDRLAAPPLRVFEAMMHVWAQPETVITVDHLDLRDALLRALASMLDVYKRPSHDD